MSARSLALLPSSPLVCVNLVCLSLWRFHFWFLLTLNSFLLSVAQPLPKSISREWEEASNQRALEMKLNPITGTSRSPSGSRSGERLINRLSDLCLAFVLVFRYLVGRIHWQGLCSDQVDKQRALQYSCFFPPLFSFKPPLWLLSAYIRNCTMGPDPCSPFFLSC